MSNFADVISLSITDGDIKTQAVVDDVLGAGMKTREVMAKLQLIENSIYTEFLAAPLEKCHLIRRFQFR